MIENVAIFGIGFVGLPLSLTYTKKGVKVIGVDVSKNLINSLKNGITNSCELFDEETADEVLKNALKKDLFVPTLDAAYALKKCSNIIVTVGVPIKSDLTLDFTFLDNVAATIGKYMGKGSTIVLRSTVPPQTTRFRFKPIIEEESHMLAGKDFYLAYSSERMAEGKAYEELTSSVTPVAGINEESVNKATEVINAICSSVLPVQSIETVEIAKVLENVSRDVNIALVNELALYTNELNVDIFKVIEVANTHKRVKLLSPGPGVGGYCIPNAFFYLDKVEPPVYELKLCKTARFLNDNMPNEVIRIAEETLTKIGKDPCYANYALFGLAMKDYSNDLRSSPALKVLELMRAKNYSCNYFDPFVVDSVYGMSETFEEFLEGADCLMILCRQNFPKINDLNKIKKLMNSKPIIIDTRNIFDSNLAEKKGFIIKKI